MVGELLSTLDDLGMANDTIITFHGDHGAHISMAHMLIHTYVVTDGHSQSYIVRS